MTDTATDMRERILEAAERCFYDQGITATGVDTLADEAGISKRTLYNYFPSKDAVVTAYLERREERWQRRLAEALEGIESPTEKVLAYIRIYCATDDLEGFRGCPFINASAEIADADHPALSVIQDSVTNVADGIAAILSEAGADDPHELAERILLVLEGAMSVSGIRRNGEAYDTAERTVASMMSHLEPA